MNCKLLNLPKISDPRGNLTFVQYPQNLPFVPKRIYWIYDVPGGEVRGGHAFKKQEELIIAISGSFDVIVEDSGKKEVFNLNRSYKGLHIPSGKWRSLENFSTNSLALVLASTFFDENDYIRSYEEYLKFQCVIKDKNLITNLEVISPTFDLTKTTVLDCKVLELDINHKKKGNITVVENNKNIPFQIKRVYFLYDVPGGEYRGGHAHKNLYQLIIAASGSFDITIDDGLNKKKITLNRPYQGLFIVPGIWREIDNFSSGSTCLVLASENYDEEDYIRDYCNFKFIKS